MREPAAAEQEAVLSIIFRRHHDDAEIGPLRRDAKAIGVRRPAIDRVAGDEQMILAVFGHDEAIRGRIAGAGEEAADADLFGVVVLQDDVLLLGEVDEFEVEIGRSAEAMAEGVDDVDFALLRVEGVPIAIAFLVDAARDLARYFDLLRLVRSVVVVVLQHDRSGGERQQDRVGIAESILEPAEQTLPGIDRAEEVELRRIGGNVDGDGQLLQHDAAFDRLRVAYAAGQTSAIDRDLRRFARFDDRRMDRVDPGAFENIEPIEVVEAARGVGEVIHAEQVVAVGRGGEIEEAVFVRLSAAIDELIRLRVEQPHLGVEPTIDARGRRVEQDAFALLGGDLKVIDLSRGGDAAVDRGADGDLLGLFDVVVRLFFQFFVEVADDEDARIADAEIVEQADVVRPDRHALVDRDVELRDLRRILLHPRRRGLLRIGGRFGRDNGRRLDAGMAEPETVGRGDVGAVERDFERGSRLGADGKDAGEDRLGPEVAVLDLGRTGGGRQSEERRADQEKAHRNGSSKQGIHEDHLDRRLATGCVGSSTSGGTAWMAGDRAAANSIHSS